MNDKIEQEKSLENKEILDAICKSLDEHKANNVRAIDISGISIMSDYFVIASAGNANHVHALCDYLEEDMKKLDVHYTHIEGYDSANWILMDYGDIVVHIFDDASREFYDLEHIWRDGKIVEAAV